MKCLRPFYTAAFFLFLCGFSFAQERQEIAFPDLPGYRTLKCDLHSHTVFSDGKVWPTVRVDEAWRLGFDALAISDHIEYQPHKADVPTNHNRPYELAADQAARMGILLIKATEITRDTPPGHFNALFLSDVNPLDTEDFVEAVKRANDQGAFVFWNHQGWKGEEKGAWLDVHTKLHENELFQGMEVCNGGSYYPTAHKWCMEKGFTMLGNSDIHEPDLNLRSTAHDHRTINLVFAKERTLAGIKEALQQGRTAVWYKNQLIGREDILAPLFAECVKIDAPHYRTNDTVFIKIHNLCDVDVELKQAGQFGPPQGRLPARSTTLVPIGTQKPDETIELKYTVKNFLVAPDKGLEVTWAVPGKEKAGEAK